MTHYEIERKYLIDLPDERFLAAQPDCAVWDIEQIYLLGEPGETRRIRRVVENGQTRCYQTTKRRVSAATADERESQIGESEYNRLRAERDPSLQTILKRRYRIPFAGRTLEIELESEEEPVHIPDWLRVRREVTSEKRYKNVALARKIPAEDA